mmetsp:Transcript_6190/g.10023  ORF Transcript_6190/g.10023 Transcript_6190/m.10023 type:complete len:123 (+) Transcript_6190:1449-1817(+)|eukprot:CAMPEP_0170486770 /NCGR_PEP_ID=MMETSP0208-20121228/5703_1 /TAXON_ID=197538 /ORGANISM="Strombidium inclinatum, Strain S3" /LENGTH=122 /DNA_ID=CAMNT_0010760809 /DNA_START=1444 /DNA_END=1812 /DNA_ORIENTATION=-
MEITESNQSPYTQLSVGEIASKIEGEIKKFDNATSPNSLKSQEEIFKPETEDDSPRRTTGWLRDQLFTSLDKHLAPVKLLLPPTEQRLKGSDRLTAKVYFINGDYPAAYANGLKEAREDCKR